MASATQDALKDYLADSPPTVVPLEIRPHFEALSDEEKLYAHYISVAAFGGSRIVFRQCSPESEDIYDFIISVYKACNGDWKDLKSNCGLSDEELDHFLSYSAQFLGNCGNYKGFGDSKFIPRLASDRLETLAKASNEAAEFWAKIKHHVYETKDLGLMHFGYPDKGHLSNYYPDSPDMTEMEILAINSFLEGKKLLPENTRLRKVKGGYEVLIASSQTDPASSDRDAGESEWELDGELKGKKLVLRFGDHSKEMTKVADALLNAGKYAANDIQKSLMSEYAKSFRTGSIEAFKQSQRYWIKDKGPMVESDIGFIETYRDPSGIRGEWEGFVAMVNKSRTEAFGKLVDAAPALIPKLPWSKSFEKDTFLSPDFTSLEVLSFAGSGIPAGINIPNYDDIRQNLGFKNVSLGNVLSAKTPNDKIPFIRDQDMDLFQKHRNEAFEVQVGLHELLGHGCGKLLQETEPGVYNFDPKKPPISPLTGKAIESWYKPGETWSSVFGPIASSYEECRAECVAMVFNCEFQIMELFGIGDGKEDINGVAGDVLFSSYLTMALSGLAALEYWDPKSRKWGQAHMQARYSILQTFLAAGEDFIKLESKQDDLDDLVIHINRNKITTTGRKAVEAYLQKLHIYKATADFPAAKKMYDEITHVDEHFGAKVRKVVLAKKKPRKVFVQANTMIQKEDGKVVLKEYEASCEGMIASYADREYI